MGGQPFFLGEKVFLRNTLMERVLSTLSQAEKSLDLALFSFSNKRLAREVISCMNRGVKVRLVTENTQIDQLGGQVGK